MKKSGVVYERVDVGSYHAVKIKTNKSQASGFTWACMHCNWKTSGRTTAGRNDAEAHLLDVHHTPAREAAAPRRPADMDALKEELAVALDKAREEGLMKGRVEGADRAIAVMDSMIEACVPGEGKEAIAIIRRAVAERVLVPLHEELYS